MISLHKKYYNDSLTPGELVALNKHLAEDSEEMVTEDMRQVWSNGIDVSAADTERINAVKERIDSRIGDNTESNTEYTESSTLSRRWLWAYRVAAVLLPLFVLSTLYLLNRPANATIEPQQVVVYTARGERASVELPDGTNVVLSYESRLAYDASDFTTNRSVEFSGEAYFSVAKDENHPFAVNGSKLRVEVLGTKFNISARDQRSSTAGLVLDEGCVRFTSLATNESVVLNAGESVEMDYGTGRIKRDGGGDRKITSSWQQNTIKCVRVDFKSIIAELENLYGVHILLSPEVDSLKPFTGTLPMNDLSEAKRILEVCYNLNVKQDNKDIVISKRK